MSNHFVINTEAAIYKDGKWLVGIRSKTENEAPGLLSFVGGTVEHGDPITDTLENAIIREVNEEINVKVKVLDVVNNTSFVSKRGNHVINVVFLCSLESGEPRISGTEEMENLLWLTKDEIMNYPNVPRWLCESLEKAELLKNSNAKLNSNV
jgi:ADP-ribose pyrophosphatase YjhB (NUDIX family)